MGRGSPPLADTRWIGTRLWGANTISPERFQVAPRSTAALQIFWTVPVARSIFLSLPDAKKPTKRALGDQNGPSAPSVPARRFASNSSSERSHSADSPDSPAATKTILRPSGEGAADLGTRVCFSGAEMTNRTGRPVSIVRSRHHSASAAITAKHDSAARLHERVRGLPGAWGAVTGMLGAQAS